MYIGMVGLLFLSAWLGALPALVTGQTTRESFFIYYGEALAGGTFLGISLLHMIPDAIHRLLNMHFWEYPLTALLCLTGFFLMYLIEQIGQAYKRRSIHAHHANCSLMVYLLLAMLLFHSVVVGLSLGLERTQLAAIIIMLALFVHKASEAFALSVSMNRSHLSQQVRLFILSVFSLATPLGIGIGWLMTRRWPAGVSPVPEGLFDALAAGTFLFMSLHLAKTRVPFPLKQKWMALFFTVFGFAVMATVALYA